MARKPFQKLTSAEGIANGSSEDNKLLTAGIGIVRDGKIEPPSSSNPNNQYGGFLLNPDSIEDSKVVNWHAHAVPGQPNPVYQWVSGGPRTLAFDALVTRDISATPKPVDPIASLANSALSAIGGIASSFFGVSIPPLSGLLSKNSEGNNGLSIAEDLAFYRSLYKPNYSIDGNLESSPPLIVLYVADSLIEGVDEESKLGLEITPTTLLWFVSHLKIKITKFLMGLSPLEAIVSFQLTQYMISPIAQPEDSEFSGTSSLPTSVTGLFEGGI